MLYEGLPDTDPRAQVLFDLELRFPPLSRTVTEVSALLSNRAEAPGTERLIEIIQRDPVVVSSVLRRINSAYYGLQRHFDDISKAVLMIGLLEVSNIVLTSGYVGVRKSITRKAHAAILEHLIRMSVGAGFFMRLFASRIHVSHAATAYTTGLLHNVGRLVLLYNDPETYVSLWENRRHGFAPTAEEEREYLGIDHMHLGGIAAAHWNLPSPIGDLIEAYQSPGHVQDSTIRSLALCLNVSVSLSEQLCAFIATRDNDNAAPPTLVLPPESALLSAACHLSQKDLVDLTMSNQGDALRYIDTMAQ